MVKKDKCWLKKHVAAQVFATFYFEQSDRLTDTIKREMRELFPECQYVEDSKASLAFNVSMEQSLGDEGFEITKEEHQTIVYANTSKGRFLINLFEC